MRSIILAFIGAVLMACTICICFSIHPFEIEDLGFRSLAALLTLIPSYVCSYFAITGK